MRKRSQTRLAAFLALFLLLTGLSGGPTTARQMITGAQNTERTNKLTSEIRWHRSMAQAQEDARRDRKLVFWVNMLGTMSGAT